MWCADPYVELLKRQGYCLVRLPRADIRPAQVLVQAGRDLQSAGELGSAFVPGTVPLPFPRTDIPVADLRGQGTGRLGAGLGLSILGDVIQALGGGTAGLDGAYQRARRFSFTFREVLRDSIDLVELDHFLSQAELHPMGTNVRRLLDADELYVITATLKSNKLTVEAHGEQDSALGVEASAIQSVVGAQVRVAQEQSTLSKMTYTGPKPLVFAIQAVRLLYRDGFFSALKPVDTRVAMRGLSEEDEPPAIPHGQLASEGPFMRLA